MLGERAGESLDGGARGVNRRRHRAEKGQDVGPEKEGAEDGEL